MSNYFYLSPVCRHKTRFYTFMVCARVRSEFGINFTYIKEPERVLPEHAYKSYFKNKITSDCNHYLVYKLMDAWKGDIAINQSIDEISNNPISELIYSLTENFSQYVYTDWFNEDCLAVSAGRDRRRRYELRKEMFAKLDNIKPNNWRERTVLQQQKTFVELL